MEASKARPKPVIPVVAMIETPMMAEETVEMPALVRMAKSAAVLGRTGECGAGRKDSSLRAGWPSTVAILMIKAGCNATGC